MAGVPLERDVVEALEDRTPNRADSLEALLSLLLSELLGWSPRASDGFLILREEFGAGHYFTVGMLILIEDQSRHPVAIELEWIDRLALKDGVVRVGMAPDSRSKYRTGEGAENTLLAYPREAVDTLSWKHVFHRGATGWQAHGAGERQS